MYVTNVIYGSADYFNHVYTVLCYNEAICTTYVNLLFRLKYSQNLRQTSKDLDCETRLAVKAGQENTLVVVMISGGWL